ncbi:hypothetical protein PBY51_015678 [Eleginops maclovinus]|uniref:Uncharacterized protein n=1 Tax=Eleginops maclovinus TaxID=56733 RepID=A0AAN7XHN5_ELEMC|nr:hypothetical protein PBY51_015678 [Eleginops maclovinus]
MPEVLSTPTQMGGNSSGSAAGSAVKSPSAAWPRDLSPNPNWNPERNAIHAGWPDSEEGWLQIQGRCFSSQKAC